MREIIQTDYSYEDENYASIFIGYCDLENKLQAYVKMDYPLFADGYIGSELGIDFGIDFIEEDNLITMRIAKPTSKTNDFIKTINIRYVTKLIEEKFPVELPFLCNACIIIGGLKYEGKTEEVDNPEYGCFKFIGAVKMNE